MRKWFQVSIKRTVEKYIKRDVKKNLQKQFKSFFLVLKFLSTVQHEFGYSKTLNKQYIERIHQMLYSLLSDNGMLQIFSFFN